MGSWSHEAFGNDTAGDWAYGLAEAKDLSYVEAALDTVLANGGEYLEAPESEEAIAAIEVIAKILGKGTQKDSYTEGVDAWVAKLKAKPTPALLEKARRAIDRITSPESELLELWEEAGDPSDWQQSIAALREAVST